MGLSERVTAPRTVAAALACAGPKTDPNLMCCQQPPATDAPDKNAAWAKRAFFIGLVDGVLLMLALWLAFQAQRQFQPLQRPFVHVAPRRATPIEDPARRMRIIGVNIGYDIANVGGSPAIVSQIGLGVYGGKNAHLASCLAVLTLQKDVPRLLEERSHPHSRSAVIEIDPHDWRAFALGAGKFYVIGQVLYDNVAGQRYESRFCWEFNGRTILSNQGPANSDKQISRWRLRLASLARSIFKLAATRWPSRGLRP